MSAMRDLFSTQQVNRVSNPRLS